MNNHRIVIDRETTRVWRRRDWLAVAGLAVLGAPALAAASDDWKTKARKNLKLGIDSRLYSGLPVEEAARRIKADGFSNVLTAYQFADARLNPLAPDWQAVKKITDAFERHGIRVAAAFGYYNVVHPDPARRKQGEARMLAMIANCKRLGAASISTETGTFNAKSEWMDSPENATEAAYQECRKALENLARAAEKAGAVVSIEAYWRNVIGSIDRAERILREVDSPSLKLVMDPCNYFRKEDLPRMQPMLKEMFRRLGRQIVVAHAKDVKASSDGTDLPAAGRGVLDYPLYLRLLAELDRPMDLILEHLSLDDMPRAREYVRSKM